MSSSDPSNFSRATPLVWESQGGYYVPSNQPLPSSVSHIHGVQSPHPQQLTEWSKSCAPNKRKSDSGEHDEGPPTKKSSTKWNAEENQLIIELRGQGMKWSDISRRIPGRTELACRLHYQNYLEKRGDWDEERKNKLARVYER